MRRKELYCIVLCYFAICSLWVNERLSHCVGDSYQQCPNNCHWTTERTNHLLFPPPSLLIVCDWWMWFGLYWIGIGIGIGYHYQKNKLRITAQAPESAHSNKYFHFLFIYWINQQPKQKYKIYISIDFPSFLFAKKKKNHLIFPLPHHSFASFNSKYSNNFRDFFFNFLFIYFSFYIWVLSSTGTLCDHVKNQLFHQKSDSKSDVLTFVLNCNW